MKGKYQRRYFENQLYSHNMFWPRCGWFTFSPEEKFCQLLSSCKDLKVSSCHNCLGGPFGCKVVTVQGCTKGQCQGDLINFESVSSMEKCQVLCRSTEGCKWFTFTFSPNPLCLLFRNCLSKVETCSSCFSGEPRCKLGKNHSNSWLACFGHVLEKLFYCEVCLRKGQ